MPIPAWIAQMGAQAGGQVLQSGIGAGMGLIMQGGQDRRQIRQSEKLQNLEILGQKHMVDYNMMKQLEMWKATNYGAQVDQLKQAGLNPGLLYGMSGGGGTTTGQPTGHGTPQQAPKGGGEALALSQTMMGLGLQKAQQKNIEADTKLKEIDATKKAGVDTVKTETESRSLEQGILNQDAQEKLTRMQTVWQELQNSIARQTIKDAMQIIENTVRKQEEEIKELKLQNQLNEAQMKDKITMMKYQAIGTALENIKTNAQTENIRQDTLTKIQEVARSIQQGIQQWVTTSADQSYKHTLEAEIRGLYDEVPNPIKELIDKLLFIVPAGRGKHNPVTGFTPGGKN